MLKRGFKTPLAEANAVIESVSVQDLDYLLEDDETVLVDVRETVERENDGLIPGSVPAPRELLEFLADPESPSHDATLDPELRIILYCGTSGRSSLAAKTLIFGDSNLISVLILCYCHRNIGITESKSLRDRRGSTPANPARGQRPLDPIR